MKLAVDKNVPIPAYQQVVDGVASAIARGELDHGSRLPSVRNLAVDLGLNVNTVARAYRDLERAGIIDTMPGMGTFVAEAAPPVEAWPTSRTLGRGRAGSAGARRGQGAAAALAEAPPPAASPGASWREHVAAARSLALAEGLSVEQFLVEVEQLAHHEAAASVLVVAPSEGEARDVQRCLPPELAARSRPAAVDAVSDALASSASPNGTQAATLDLVVSTFPALGRVKAALADRELAGERTAFVPIETQLTSETVARLAELPPHGRIALVTVEKEHWDHEANDVMRIVGRNRWLKMVLLENGERGLRERLEPVDVVLAVPRALEAARVALAELADGGDSTPRQLVELVRQLTARSSEHLEQALPHAGRAAGSGGVPDVAPEGAGIDPRTLDQQP